MTPNAPPQTQLLVQLAWLVRLRWIAAATVLAGGLLNAFGLRWYSQHGAIIALGAGILLYNAFLFLLLRQQLQRSRPRSHAMLLAWAQMLADLAALTTLVLWTGGLHSPILNLYVLHMVFASMLLPRRMPYAAAAAAAAMLALALAASQQLPSQRADYLASAGWLLTLGLTVYLANRITLSLRRQRRRLVRQNHQIRAMTDRLRQQQQAMIQQEKLAAMGQMAAGVAHEIANPLASMDSLLQLMQRQPDKPRPQSLQTLRHLLQRVHDIVRQLTTFAHPGQTHWQDVDLNEMVRAALELLRYDARLQRVALTQELSPQAGHFRGDPRALQQVLVNLIINALDAMEQTPHPLLCIATCRDGLWCCVSVRDNGHGVRPEHLSRLFEPFFTTKPVGKGTGLGLSISHALLRQQGGQIDVESPQGRGACFRVRLPALTAGESPTALAASRTSPPTLPSNL